MLSDNSRVGSQGLYSVGFSHLKKNGEVLQASLRTRHLGKLPPVFPNGWYSLAASGQVPVGKVLLVAALGENFAVFRDSEGRVHVLDAYCPHLGANMAVGGHVEGDCLVCPFHGWQFRGSDGVCVFIPYLKSGKTPPEQARVKVWPSCERNDAVMVWYHAEGEAPSWEPPAVAEVEDRRWSSQGSATHHVACHLQEIAENGADIAHFFWIHGPGEVPFLRHDWELQNWGSHPEPHLNSLQIVHRLVVGGWHLSFINVDVDILQVLLLLHCLMVSSNLFVPSDA
ncbi:nvd [Cordylochernes scorpioides]|uniref:cholesterol 7-desaturase n=1 Tax=Cordylochernes scorpioides TaxID=51811 RepID=A0ABY6LRR6_9ARAC|nr:nvd [Cordylochernes scorpioides]